MGIIEKRTQGVELRMCKKKLVLKIFFKYDMIFL